MKPLSVARIRRRTIPPQIRTAAATGLFSVFQIMLITATWPLWWGESSFPALPLLPVTTPVWVEKTLTVTFLLTTPGLALFGWADSRSIVSRGLTVSCMGTGICLAVMNQHRLQAWHWLYVLVLASSATFSRGFLLAALRQLISTVYVCSALSRITPAPAGSMTAAVVSQLLTLTGVPDMASEGEVIAGLCHAFTAGEAVIGLLLILPRTRMTGCVGAMLLHITLLIALGPAGLNQHAAVLLWNTCFLCVLPCLFWGRDELEPSHAVDPPRGFRTVISAIWLFPLSGLWGFADNWPAWQLYSPRPEQWVLRIDPTARDALPRTLVSHTADPAPFSNWSVVRLDRWSLEETGSPLYPQGRFQLGMIAWIVEQLPDNAEFLVDISEPDRRFWWRRSARRITNRVQLRQERERFLLPAVALPTPALRRSTSDNNSN